MTRRYVTIDSRPGALRYYLRIDDESNTATWDGPQPYCPECREPLIDWERPLHLKTQSRHYAPLDVDPPPVEFVIRCQTTRCPVGLRVKTETEPPRHVRFTPQDFRRRACRTGRRF